MLTKLINEFNGDAFIYYFDVSFNETLRRHSFKPYRDGYGEAEMRSWWQDEDYINVVGEKFITDAMSEDETVEMMWADLSGGVSDGLA